jgi:hypothetical protein
MYTTFATYGACAILIIAYAWGRFNTPATNRSSTRQALFWASCIGYIVAVLTLFAALCSILQIGAWRAALLGPADDAALPAPLIATLAMTTLLSSVPILKRLDAWILGAFLDWGAIPAEVKRRAATLTTDVFQVSAQDVVELRKRYGDGNCGETLTDHLRETWTDEPGRSEYRLTRVVKLYNRLGRLAGVSRHEKFFAEAGEEFDSLKKRTEAFLKRADKTLNIAARLRALDGAADYEELMRDRRQEFKENCASIFGDLAVFLARAALRSEPTEEDIVRCLRDAGFEAAEPICEPEFPVNSLTLLALGVFVYLGSLSLFFVHLAGPGQQPQPALLMAFKFALARIASISVVIVLMQKFAFFRRAAGEDRKFFAYGVCGVISAGAAALVCLPFALGFKGGFVAGVQSSVPIVMLSGVLCAVIAFCCDYYPDDSVAVPKWARFAEAAACGGTMALGASFFYFGGLMPPGMRTMGGGMVAAWIAMPSIMALVIGAYVPYIYRTARCAAEARRTCEARGITLAMQRPAQNLVALPGALTETAAG